MLLQSRWVFWVLWADVYRTNGLYCHPQLYPFIYFYVFHISDTKPLHNWKLLDKIAKTFTYFGILSIHFCTVVSGLYLLLGLTRDKPFVLILSKAFPMLHFMLHFPLSLIRTKTSTPFSLSLSKQLLVMVLFDVGAWLGYKGDWNIKMNNLSCF